MDGSKKEKGNPRFVGFLAFQALMVEFRDGL
jgi:hypothetical protein